MPSLSCLALLALGCTGTEATLITTLADPVGAGGAASGAAGAIEPGAQGGAPFSEVSSWQIQLSGELDDSFDVELYDIDLHTSSEAEILSLRDAGRRVACYFSAGTLETWRGDGDDLPDSVLGNPHASYPSERWLDVRDASVRELMLARISLAVAKGCQAIQPANLAVFVQDSGFVIDERENHDFVSWLAGAAHAAELSVAWSDDPELFVDIEQVFDWAIATECFDENGCVAWDGFDAVGKAVFLVEIGSAADAARLCSEAAALGWPLVIKDSDYTAFRAGCP